MFMYSQGRLSQVYYEVKLDVKDTTICKISLKGYAKDWGKNSLW